MAEQLTIVDAHQHFWEPKRNYHPWPADKPVAFRYGDYSRINRRYLPMDYLEDARNYRAAGTVYIETEWDPRDPIGEMVYVQSLRRKTGYPSVAVAQAWLDRGDVVPVLEQLATFDFVRGVRQKPRVNRTPLEAGSSSMMEKTWRAGFAVLGRLGLRFDLQTPWWHLHEAADLARVFPDTQIILDHTGLPADRSAEGLAAWRAAMATLAACPNVAEDLGSRRARQGVDGRGKPPGRARHHRFVRARALHVASNFPVDSLCGTFDEIYGGFDAITRGFTEGERRQMFGGNAMSVYAIPADALRVPLTA